ncbi:MAG TPA: NUDIX hydrolase [Kiritimatiellia bacterium]|nr:NUDIX hydrolase [Kiritimatiellia bacterium]
MFSETTLSKRTVFQGRILNLEVQDVRLENGEVAYREIVRHHGAVGVLGQLPDGPFVFVRQFRKPVERMMTEVVAGLLDAGESPEAAARREVREETGLEVVELVNLGSFYASPGFVDEHVTAFFARLQQGEGLAQTDEDERVEVVLMSAGEVEAMLNSGEPMDAKTVAIWGLYRMLEQRQGAQG